MQKILILAVVFSLVPFAAASQSLADIGKQGSVIDLGLGVSFVDSNPYLSFALTPDLSFGNLGVGLNVEVLIPLSDEGETSLGWKGDGGFLRAINYLRWGTKGDADPVYARIGTLGGATLGNGMILSYYNNAADYYNRKTGLELDIDFGMFGFESVVGNFAAAEIFGGRVYVRPLHSSKIPVFDALEIGASLAGDATAATNDKAVTIWGADLSLPLIKSGIFSYKLYADFASIFDYGQGFAAGMMANIDIIKLFEAWARFEWRTSSKRFIPSYFNSMYDYDKFKDAGKLALLDSVSGASGPYGELGGHLLNIIKFIGYYCYAETGVLHIEAALDDSIPLVKFTAAYDKAGIENLGDMFSLDERSVFSTEIGYKGGFWYVSFLYRWNFVYNEETGEYDTQKTIEPQVGLSISF